MYGQDILFRISKGTFETIRSRHEHSPLTLTVVITVTSHKRYSVSHHWQLYWLAVQQLVQANWKKSVLLGLCERNLRATAKFVHMMASPPLYSCTLRYVLVCRLIDVKLSFQPMQTYCNWTEQKQFSIEIPSKENVFIYENASDRWVKWMNMIRHDSPRPF